MEKSRAIDLLDNLIGMIEDNQDNDYDTAFRMAIEALKAQLSKEGTTSDLISRTETVEHLRITLGATVPIADYDDGYVDGVQFAINTVSTMPTIQPEPTDIDAREAVYNLAEKIGIHQLFALTVELRGEPIQPEPAIPLSWIEKYIEWLKSLDNEFANLAAAHISVMVKKWRDEQNERTD